LTVNKTEAGIDSLNFDPGLVLNARINKLPAKNTRPIILPDDQYFDNLLSLLFIIVFTAMS
jgi:hypothetical protein